MLETSRLILRPFEERDYAQVYEYTNLQTVHCFADMRFDSLEAARQEVLRRQEDAEFYWAICLKESGRVIGEVFAHPEQSTKFTVVYVRKPSQAGSKQAAPAEYLPNHTERLTVRIKGNDVPQ